MSIILSPFAGIAGQLFDDKGKVLSGGQIYTYAAGTTTPQVTFTSTSGAAQHTNPIILDAAGRVPGGEIWLSDGVYYKFVLQTSTGVVIGTYDNILGLNSSLLNYAVSEEIQTATEGQTVFTLQTTSYRPGTNTLSVFINGVNQYMGTAYSYVESSGSTVTFDVGLPEGAEVKFTTAVSLSTTDASADLVGYLPAGATAVPTNVQSKLREVVSVKDFGAVGDGSTDDATAIELADDYAASARVPVFFPPGSYRVGRQIVRKAQSAWFGPAQQSGYTSANEVQIYGTVGDIGDGNPMIRCATVGVGTSVSGISFENIEFISDKLVDFANLSATTSAGVILVDASNVKNGLVFVGCSFKNAAYGVRQPDDSPYLDKTTFDRCHFRLLYRAIDCNPTAGLSLANCFVYDCFDWINTKTGGRPFGAEVFLNATSFNNSSFSSEYCGIKAAAITATGCWFEGGNHWLNATKYARAEGCYFSEAMSASGSTKFSFYPNTAGEACTLFSIGNRVATNTRLCDLSAFTDKTVLSITCIGNYGGSSFSETSSITTVLTTGIDYEGYGNSNSSAWNASQHNRKMSIGSKRGPDNQVDIAQDSAGTGVVLRVLDTSTSGGKAGIVLERSQSGAGDWFIQSVAGDINVQSSTDGATWVNYFKFNGTTFGFEPATDSTQTLGATGKRWSNAYLDVITPGQGGCFWTSGAGSPEGVVIANVGSLYTRVNGGGGSTLYVKESGTGSTGWAAK